MEITTMVMIPFFYRSDGKIILDDEYSLEEKLIIEINIDDEIYYLDIPKRYEEMLEENDELILSRRTTNIGNQIDILSLKRNGLSISTLRIS